jgi:hypothetical protein
MTGPSSKREFKRMPKPGELPCAIDKPRSAFLNGWWSGILVGMAIGASLMVVLAKGLR